MFDTDFFRTAVVAAPVIIFSLSVHEFAHAWSALKFGDETATRLGRLTLNPLAHLDLMGSLVMVMTGFQFGWAKPVPVNLLNVRNYRVADFWISFAGPLSNIGLAIISSLAFNILPLAPGSYLYSFFYLGMSINLILALFNMIPLFPLDGSHMLRSVLPTQYEEPLARFEQIAPMILLALIILPNFIPKFDPLFGLLLPVHSALMGLFL